jgi:hypothetical protein
MKAEAKIGAPRWTRIGRETIAERVSGYSVYHIEDGGEVIDVPPGEYGDAVAWLNARATPGKKLVDGKESSAQIWPAGYFLHEHREAV